ncbi:hypothetical protein F4825DRAFT_419803 [Nemania diffusa]|nr:hypothetical protein F4825DRAFT_419803 [Nemania diffusa]
MADNSAETIAKAPVATAEAKAPDTVSGLPPITKEPAATAEVAVTSAVPTESTTTEAAAPSSDTNTQPEAPAAAEAQKDLTNKSSEPGTAPLQQEKPSNPTPTTEPPSTTTETVASGVKSNAPADPDDKAVEPPKPVSLEEIRDEDLPKDNASDAKKQAEDVAKADVAAPPTSTSVETTEASAINSASAKNGDVSTGKKRKADGPEDAAKLEADSTKDEHTEPPEKKLKTNGATNGAANGGARKPGRPRKDKTSIPTVGKTARKTRSQGAAE